MMALVNADSRGLGFASRAGADGRNATNGRSRVILGDLGSGEFERARGLADIRPDWKFGVGVKAHLAGLREATKPI
jgi:hypothetical protein